MMVHAKNYETASAFVKVIQGKLLASFFLDTVYNRHSRINTIRKQTVPIYVEDKAFKHYILSRSSCLCIT